MLIGEIAKQFGIRTSAIRYYEGIGLLPPVLKINTRRHFSDDVIIRLRIIRAAQSMGFTIREIKILMNGFDSKKNKGKEWRPLAEKKVKELEALIKKIQRMKKLLESAIACECVSLKECNLL